MANELKHGSVGSQLSQTEWEAVGAHVFNSQATGDIVYASSSTQLTRLGIGSTGAVLTVTGGIPAWDTTWTPTGHLIPATDDSYDLGSSAAAWQDLFLEGDITLTDAGTLATSAGALTITSAAAATWSTSAGALTITSAAALNLNPTSGSAIVLDGTINVDAGVVTGATSITSTAFAGDITGDVTGNADTATVATSFTASANNSTDETVYPVFLDGATGTQGAETDTGLTYNPSSGILTATQFTGAVSGTATLATSITASANNSTDETVYPTFLDGATGTQGIETDTGLTYNPSSGILTATQFTGAVSGNATTSTTATNVTASANNSTDETVYPAFVDGATGGQGIETDTGLTYNPSSGILTATAFAGNITGNVTGNASGTAATVTGGTQASITTVANVVEVGALDAGSITSGFGNIDNGSSTLDTGALDASTGTFSGVLKTDDTTNATSTTDGSLQTDGGLSVALDGIFGDDVTLITDAAVLNLGVGSDVSLTHDNATGGTLSGTPMTIESLGASALANDDYTGIVLQFIAHEDLDVGQAVYIHTDDGEVGLADANALATMPAIGVVVGADASADAVVKVLTHGIYNDSDGFGGALTEGATMYLGEAVGTVTATIPDADGDFVQIMGIACGPRDVFINPSLDIIERA